MNVRMIVPVLALLMLTAAAKHPAERVIDGDAMIDVRIDGAPARLRVDPAAPAMPLINAELAGRAGLKMTGSWGVGIGYAVGGTSVMTRTQVVRADFGDGPAKRRIGWARRPFAAVADGSIGPAGLAEHVIRFQLRPPAPEEQSVAFRMDKDSALFGMFGNFSATYARIEIGGQPMRVRFDPYHPRSLATAGAGARLARLNDGTIFGAAVPTEIFFGIERPVRTLALRRPLELGPLSITRLGIRTADYGNVAGIRDANAAKAPVDPDEAADDIVVTGKRKKHDPRRDIISLGADYLSRCSSIVFDRKADTIRLTCLPSG